MKNKNNRKLCRSQNVHYKCMTFKHAYKEPNTIKQKVILLVITFRVPFQIYFWVCPTFPLTYRSCLSGEENKRSFSWGFPWAGLTLT